MALAITYIGNDRASKKKEERESEKREKRCRKHLCSSEATPRNSINTRAVEFVNMPLPDLFYN